MKTGSGGDTCNFWEEQMARCLCTLSTGKNEHALFVQCPGVFSRLQMNHGSCWVHGATENTAMRKEKQTMNPHSIQAAAPFSALLHRPVLWQPSRA